jgi:hypothetical protein
MKTKRKNPNYIKGYKLRLGNSPKFTQSRLGLG